MSNGRQNRMGYVHEESQDKGPFKLTKVVADGKVMDVTVLDFTGVSGSPLKDSPVLILTTDDDDGKAYGIIAGPPTKDRVDGLKPGELDLRNHKRGQSIRMDDDGNVKTEAKANVETTSEKDTIIKTKAGNTIKEFESGDIGVEPAGGKKVYLGDLNGAGCHRVSTEAGLSSNVYAKV